MSQQDIYDKLSTHHESRCPTDRSRGDQKQEALDLSILDGVHRAAGAGYHPGNRQPVPEGNKERGSLADRAGSMRILAERPRQGGKVDHLPDVSRDVVAGGRLGANFFCSQDFEDRRSLRIVFPALAFQLTRRRPCFRKELIQVLRMSLVVRRESLCSQMETLLNPLKPPKSRL